MHPDQRSGFLIPAKTRLRSQHASQPPLVFLIQIPDSDPRALLFASTLVNTFRRTLSTTQEPFPFRNGAEFLQFLKPSLRAHRAQSRRRPSKNIWEVTLPLLDSSKLPIKPAPASLDQEACCGVSAYKLVNERQSDLSSVPHPSYRRQGLPKRPGAEGEEP